MNCAHCITDKVKVLSGMSMSLKSVTLMLRTLGRGEPSVARVRNAETPGDKKVRDLLLCLEHEYASSAS